MAKAKPVKEVPFQRKSRAVLRIIEAGTYARCERCDLPVRFKAAQKVKPRQVIANRYSRGKWVATIHFHAECYLEEGEPYGPPDKRTLMRS